MRTKIKIYKSNTSIEAQAINIDKTVFGKKYKIVKGVSPIEQAKKFGEDFGNSVKQLKIEQVSFDRNGSRYHGRVKSFAEGLRSAGLDF